MVSVGVMLCAWETTGRPQGSTQRPEVTEDALNKALSDRRYLMRQLKCALGEAACDPVGRRLKSKSLDIYFKP